MLSTQIQCAASVIALTAAVTTSALGATQVESREPVYKGKLLSDWAAALEKYDRDDTGFSPPATAKEVTALRTIGAAGVPWLLKWLAVPEIMDEPSPKPSRAEVVMVFQVLGPEAKAAIPGLAKMTDGLARALVVATTESWQTHNDEEQFKHAVLSLANLGPDAMPVLLTLATNLQGKAIQLEVIKAFGEAGTNGAEAVPALAAWNRDKDPKVRDAALEALVGMQQAPEVVLPALRAGLKQPDQRWNAVLRLGEFGSGAKPAIPDLIQLLKNEPDVRSRGQILFALGSIGEEPEIVVPVLAQGLHDEDDSIRANAATALGDMGGKAALKALLTATNEPDSVVRGIVFEALKKIDPKAARKTGLKTY